MPNGAEKTTVHPIGFLSKRTSAMEEKYKPFILEFRALKHTLDKFGDVIWGYHNIVDVRHRPGHLNIIADGLSHQFVNLPCEPGDGHEWTVSEDWEARMKLANDIFQVQTSQLDLTYAALRTQFAK